MWALSSWKIWPATLRVASPAFWYIGLVKAKKIKILPKPGESIRFEKNRVIKHFDDEQIIRDRVERAKILKGIVPEIIAISKHSYTYKFIPAKLLSEEMSISKFKAFLKFCQKNLWSQRPKLTLKGKREFFEKTHKFYFNKTMKRLEKFYQETNIKDRALKINGKTRPSLASILRKINWRKLAHGIPALFHGDLQPENILITKQGFRLIDWRHDFEGLKAYGDLYYDLSKLYHALIITHQVIRDGQYSVKRRGNTVEFRFLIKSNLIEFKDILEQFIIENGYDLEKVKMLTALIYLNIAPLHHYPYNELLYYLGHDMLYHVLHE